MWHLTPHHLGGDLLENLEQLPFSLTKTLRRYEFLCEGWRLYFCHLNPGKVPFNNLLLSTALEVSQVGLHFFRARMSLSPFSIPLSPPQAHARVFGLLLQAHAHVFSLLQVRVHALGLIL